MPDLASRIRAWMNEGPVLSGTECGRAEIVNQWISRAYDALLAVLDENHCETVDAVADALGIEQPDILGPCSTCGTPYRECEISADEPEYTTDANGNHEGLCCGDCGHHALPGGDLD